jgi:hypothetical protein
MIPETVFWRLLLAHLLADFTLQPKWMVARKSQTLALITHAAVVLLTSFVLLGPARIPALGQAVALTLGHVGLDRAKTLLSSRFPNRDLALYLGDQAGHLLLLAGASWWIQLALPAGQIPGRAGWVLTLLGLVFVTWVWTISERILLETTGKAVNDLARDDPPRSVFRAATFLGSFWLLRGGDLGLLLGMGLWPYALQGPGARSLVVDFAVSLLTAASLAIFQ